MSTDDVDEPQPAEQEEAGKAELEESQPEGLLALPDKSPYEQIDVDFMQSAEAAGIGRVEGPGIGSAAGEGRLLGQIIVRMSDTLDRIMERTTLHGSWSPVQLRPMVYRASVDLPFAAGPEAMQFGVEGMESPALRAARMLTILLEAQGEDDLIERLRSLGEDVTKAYEALLALISESGLTLDWQAQQRRPERVSGPSASQVLVALDRSLEEPREERWFTGVLTRADSDSDEFKIRLSEAWDLKRVIVGRYDKALEPKLEGLWNRPVRALVLITRWRRARDVRSTFDHEMLDVARARPEPQRLEGS